MQGPGDPEEAMIIKVKELRVAIQKNIDFLNQQLYKSTETVKLARQRLQEARHWLGEELNRLGTPTPYPQGDNPGNAIVSPRADVG